jgi:hypothetical protein
MSQPSCSREMSYWCGWASSPPPPGHCASSDVDRDSVTQSIAREQGGRDKRYRATRTKDCPQSHGDRPGKSHSGRKAPRQRAPRLTAVSCPQKTLQGPSARAHAEGFIRLVLQFFRCYLPVRSGGFLPDGSTTLFGRAASGEPPLLEMGPHSRGRTAKRAS